MLYCMSDVAIHPLQGNDVAALMRVFFHAMQRAGDGVIEAQVTRDVGRDIRCLIAPRCLGVEQ